MATRTTAFAANSHTAAAAPYPRRLNYTHTAVVYDILRRIKLETVGSMDREVIFFHLD